MRKPVCIAVLAAGLWALPAAAVNTEQYQIPYFGVSGSYLMTDTVRGADDGAGLQFTFGVPFESGREAIELRFFDAGYTRKIDDNKDYQSALFVDYVIDFGPLGDAQDFLGGIKPFATVGFGFVEEDVRADKHLHFGGDVGGGLLVPVFFKGWALRLEGRIQGQANDESCPNSAVCEDQADFLFDYQAGVGLQIPLTLFFDRPVAVAPVEDCPVAVVDPETGRRDCATDSDRDGVGDQTDECPGTPSGTAVNRQGCAEEQVSNDTDGDGVPNNRDECPGTQAGLQVNSKGCVIEQKTSIQGVTFQADSARLTSEGRQTLDGVAETLSGQGELKVEIAGHTDNVGSDAYNLLLSQQRADAVRSYLIEKGIDGERLTAVGYGELEPVAGNETEEGRKTNRRVEFRITTD